MKKVLHSLFVLAIAFSVQAQTNPAITSWLQNTTVVGSYYMEGNSTTISNDIVVNVQKVEYSDDFVYAHTNGVPAYPTGPFLDRNPSQAQSQDAIYQIPLNPQENTGNPTETNPGNIGVFINGVSLFDWRDGVAWNPQTMALCGGPGNDRCPGGPMATQDWNRDAIPAERAGFDCAKGHPAMGNYHHHQNPSAFKLDLDVVSDVCNLYDAEGLYVIDENAHSPLIGFAYDGFPIYGAYGFKNVDGTGGVARMKSSFQLRNMTTRNNGPDTSGDYFLGYFKEDYEHVANSDEDYLDEHNGRFCVTPEYPDGIYCYFATVDENWNSAYPYMVGPTFYGVSSRRTVNSVNEPTTVYDASSNVVDTNFDDLKITLFPNPTSDLIAVQITGLMKDDMDVFLFDLNGKKVAESQISKGRTIAYFDMQTFYSGMYQVVFELNGERITRKVVVSK